MKDYNLSMVRSLEAGDWLYLDFACCYCCLLICSVYLQLIDYRSNRASWEWSMKQCLVLPNYIPAGVLATCYPNIVAVPSNLSIGSLNLRSVFPKIQTLASNCWCILSSLNDTWSRQFYFVRVFFVYDLRLRESTVIADMKNVKNHEILRHHTHMTRTSSLLVE